MKPEFPAYSKIYLRNYNGQVYSYGRHSPGLITVTTTSCDIATPLFDLLALVKCHPLYILLRVRRELCFC